MQTAGQCHADSGTAQCRHNRASPVRSPMPPPQPVQTVPARTVSSYRASSSIPSWRPRLPTSLRAGLARQARRCKCMSLPTTLAPPRSTRTQEQSASARPHPRARLALLRRQVHLHRDDRPQLGRRAAVLRPGLVQLEAVQRARVPRDARRHGQLPIAMASRPSCSARRAAGADRSRSASGSRPLMAATYACATARCHERFAWVLSLSVRSSDSCAGTSPRRTRNLTLRTCLRAGCCTSAPCEARLPCGRAQLHGASSQAHVQLMHAISRPREALA